MNITFKGSPLSLVGQQLKTNDVLPSFTVTDNSLGSLSLDETKGVRIFLSVPSLDTSVCEQEIITFNKRAGEIPGVTVYTISMDLPFAQARWCGANDIKNVVTASDYKNKEFANATGTYIKELGLLARAAFVVDENNKVLYSEYVQEVTSLPNFEAVLQAAQNK